MPRTISLQVPPDAEAGDSLTFEVEGKELEIPIPHGSQPGDVLEIQVDNDDSSAQDNTSRHGESQEGNDDDDDADIHLNLSNGKILRFSTKEKSPTNTDGSGVVVERQGSGGGGGGDIDDGTYAHPWPSGLGFSNYWGADEARQLMVDLFGDDERASLKVLELGSGLGLVGLSLAAQYSDLAATADSSLSSSSSLPSLAKIVLSDVREGIALLQHNLARNAPYIPEETVVQATPLLWTKEEPIKDDNNLRKEKFGLILASDVLYNTESIPALVATVKRFLSSTSGLILAVRWRKPDLERSFFEALEGWQGKHWHLVYTLSCPLSWKEFGNPKLETSNRYFHQTMVSVGGKPMTLATILKDDSLQEEMTDQEAEAFENCHIQIYCLTSKRVTAKKEGTKTEETPSNGSENRKRPREGE